MDLSSLATIKKCAEISATGTGAIPTARTANLIHASYPGERPFKSSDLILDPIVMSFLNLEIWRKQDWDSYYKDRIEYSKRLFRILLKRLNQ